VSALLDPSHGGLFRSRVGRRMFVLFVLCALVPVSLVATLAYDQVSRQLEAQSRDHLRRETVATTAALYDRLLVLDDTTRALASMLARSGAPPARATLIALAGQRISALTVLHGDGTVEPVLGQPLSRPALDPQRWEHLQAGGTLLLSSPAQSGPRVLLVRAAHGILVLAEASPAFLWRFDAESEHELCVVDQQFAALHCNDRFLERWRVDLTGALSRAITGGLEHRSNNDDPDSYLQYKSLFLGAHFRAPSWVVVIGRNAGNAMLAALRFKQIFPAILLLSLLFVVLLSLVQIRRLLRPLQRLREGTSRVSEQDFSTPVQVDSGDEFEELADSFNQMSENLDEMFATLEQFSQIDGIILTAPDRNRILDTVAAHLPEIMHCDAAALIALPLRGASGSVRLVRPPAAFDPEHDVRTLDAPTSAWVHEHAQIEFIDDATVLPRALAPLAGAAPQRVLWLPFEVDGCARFAFCCTYRDGDALTARRVRNGRDLSRRLTMAIADALKGEALHRQANHDVLTGLPNRHLLGLRMQKALEQAVRDERHCALLFLDLDQFKAINDSLGHATGDQLLQRISERLALQVREVDTVARFGGDEYVILMTDMDGDVRHHARALARSLSAAVCEPCEIDAREITTSTSIGISIFPHDAASAEELLSHADIALYHAKRLGKDNWQFYSAELMMHDGRRLEIESALREALVNGGLELHYQPQIDSTTARLRGAEALLRWPGCPLGPLRPDQFVPIAEQSRLILDLGAWVVRTACAQARAWRDAGLHDLSMSVNVSPRQFRDEDLPGMIARALDEYGLDPRALTVEVTESAVMDDIEQACSMLNRLHALGVGVSIDDFGTGHSSLEHLARLPADTLKLDRSFIAGVLVDRGMSVIVETVIDMSHKLGMRVVAEGVETEEQAEFLRLHDCDLLQGYHYARAMPSEEFLEWRRLRPTPGALRVVPRR
jgi:diguanylate cyclase (GGDEF)-like protein